ncbi:MAG: hypothetical protein ABEJ83_01940 [Candidatus Nanohaloarchaea archaeon]
MDLERSRKTVLNKVKKYGEINAYSLYDKDETIQEVFSGEKMLSQVMKELANDENLLQREKDGRKWMYDLTEEGRNLLRKIRKRERQKKDTEEIFDYENGFDEFVEYFEDEKYGFRQVEKCSVGRNYVYLDYGKLQKFNHELADDLLRDPDKVLGAAEEAVASLPEVTDDPDVRVKNIDDVDTQSINELSARDRNKLVQVEGVIQSVSRPGSKIVSAVFECSQCGERYEKDQESNSKLKTPYKCDCGSKKFETLREKHKTVRYVNIKEKPDKRSREKIIAVLEGELAEDESKNLKAIGSGVSIVGYVDTYKKRKSDEFQSFRLIANNIQVEQSKWDIEDLSPNEESRIQEISRRDDVKDYLVNSYASEEIVGQELLKESFIVFLLGRTEDFGNVHFLCVGDPGTAKSALAGYTSENGNKVMKSVATGATKVGLTAAVVQDDMTNEWTAEAGSLAMADGGFHITDEIDDLQDEAYSAYNEALSEETITLSKAGLQTKLSADVAEFAIGNPSPHYSFDECEPKYEQVPISKDDLLSRFGVMLAVEDDKDIDAKMEKARGILEQNLDQSISDGDTLSDEMLFKYLSYAQRINPQFTEDAKETVLQACESLFGGEVDRIKLRHVEALAAVSIAHARINLEEEVSSEHVSQAFDFFRRCYESIGFDIGKDDFKEVESVNNQRFRRVKEAIEEHASDQEGASVDKVIDSLDMSEQSVEDIIQKLKDQGSVFESNPGKIQKL